MTPTQAHALARLIRLRPAVGHTSGWEGAGDPDNRPAAEPPMADRGQDADRNRECPKDKRFELFMLTKRHRMAWLHCKKMVRGSRHRTKNLCPRLKEDGTLPLPMFRIPSPGLCAVGNCHTPATGSDIYE